LSCGDVVPVPDLVSESVVKFSVDCSSSWSLGTLASPFAKDDGDEGDGDSDVPPELP